MSSEQSIESRLAAIEDRLAIYALIASHPPSADTADAEYTRAVYDENSVYDRGPALPGALGREAIASLVLKPEHGEAIRNGLAHFTSLPMIDLRAGEAYVTSYLQIVMLDRLGDERELPNHGISTGYRIHRVVANRWRLVKLDSRWVVKSRQVRVLDGSAESLALLSEGLSAALTARTPI